MRTLKLIDPLGDIHTAIVVDLPPIKYHLAGGVEAFRPGAEIVVLNGEELKRLGSGDQYYAESKRIRYHKAITNKD